MSSKRSGHISTVIYDISKVLVLWAWFIWFRPKMCYISEEAKKKIKGGGLIISNHNSFADNVYMQMFMPCRRHYVVAANIAFKNKFIAFLLKSLLSIEIDRDNFSLSSMKTILRLLKDGKMINIYPEGMLNENRGTLLEFKDGVAVMARMAGVPIIPTYHMYRKNWLCRARIGVGEPIYLDKLGLDTKEKTKEATEYIYQQEYKLMKYMTEAKR